MEPKLEPKKSVERTVSNESDYDVPQGTDYKFFLSLTSILFEHSYSKVVRNFVSFRLLPSHSELDFSSPTVKTPNKGLFDGNLI